MLMNFVFTEGTGCVGAFASGGCCEGDGCANYDTDGTSVCYCNQSCHEFGDCCSDIAELPCLRKSVPIIIPPLGRHSYIVNALFV